MVYCKICRKINCKEHSFTIGKRINIKEFSGSSPPEVFVGRFNYPNVNVGVLSPIEHGNTERYSSAEEWHKENLNIRQIVSLRNQLIYGQTQAHIKNLNKKILLTMQEVAMTSKSISAEFRLKKPIFANREKESSTPLINKTALVETIRLEENPKINQKVDYIISDTDAKTKTGILELEKAGLNSSQIIKILSAGLLGLKTRRKLVPTRWSITAVDDILSKEKLRKIRYFKEISEIMIFNSEYLGNHYEFLLFPSKFSFEVIERALNHKEKWQDYESFFSRKKYAESVTGAYYANRLAVLEYLEKIQRQASCLVLREILPEYDVPLGVGILRETSRAAFRQSPQKCDTIKEALEIVQIRLKQPIQNYVQHSKLIKEHNKQTRLDKWLF